MGTSKPQNTTHPRPPTPSEWSSSLFISTTIKTINTCFIMTNLIAIANRKLNFSNWINGYKVRFSMVKVIWWTMIMMTSPAWIFWWSHSIPQVEWWESLHHMSPAPRDTAPPLSLHVHVPPACRHLCLSPVEKVTRQSSPGSWPAYLFSSRLISQLVQGRADTVKSMSTQFD